MFYFLLGEDLRFGTNNIMKKLFYLNYFIYRFYEKRDPDPFIYSFFGSSLLGSLNLISIFIVFQDFAGFQFSKYYSVLILIVLLGLNYFSLYKNSKHKEIFFTISQKDNLNRKFRIFVTYLFFTIVLILLIVMYIRINRFDAL